MKKLQFLLVFVFVVTSCSKDDNLKGERENYFLANQKQITNLNEIKLKKSNLKIKRKHLNDDGSLKSFISKNEYKLRKDAKSVSIYAQPLITKDKVFFLNVNNEISAYSLTDSKFLWEKKLETKRNKYYKSTYGSVSGNNKNIAVTTREGLLYYIDSSSGEIIWKKEFNSSLTGRSHVTRKLVVVRFPKGKTEAYERKSGKKVWQHEGLQKDITYISPAKPISVRGNILVAYSTGELVLLSSKTGKVIWKYLISNNSNNDGLGDINDVVSDLNYDGKYVYVATASKSISAFDLKNKVLKWSLPFASVSNITYKEDVLFFISKGVLYAVNKDGKGIYWQKALKSISEESNLIWRGPIYSKGKVLVISEYGDSYVFDSRNGNILEENLIDSPVYINPVEIGGYIYIYKKDGYLKVIK